MKSLDDLLVSAELQQYSAGLQSLLHITVISQLKAVTDEQLVTLGMTKPEIRRLQQFFKKEFPQGALGRLRKILAKNPVDNDNAAGAGAGKAACSEHIISEDELKIQRTIGLGEFSVVQQGVWQQNAVAIKSLSKAKINVESSQVLSHLMELCSIEHQHLTQLLGIAVTQHSYLLVYELTPVKSLLDCLRRPVSGQTLSLSLLSQFAVQIADAMAYLETRRLVHRNLAARNVLLFTGNKVRLVHCNLTAWNVLLFTGNKVRLVHCNQEHPCHHRQQG
jgi:activated CDC42 kinase 1